MTDPKLMPCPFCSSADVELDQWAAYNDAIKCNSCWAWGPIFKEHDNGKKAIAAWNTRASLPAPQVTDEVRETAERVERIIKDNYWSEGLKADIRSIIQAALRPAQPVQPSDINLFDILMDLVPFEHREKFGEALAMSRQDAFQQGLDARKRQPVGISREVVEKMREALEEIRTIRRKPWTDLADDTEQRLKDTSHIVDVCVTIAEKAIALLHTDSGKGG